MDTEESQLVALASALGLEPSVLARHIPRPLLPPMNSPLVGWTVPAICQSIFAITDGFWLFGRDAETGFHFWGKGDYERCLRWGGPIHRQATEEGLFPICGDVPHLVGVSVEDGSVLATDWEVYGQQDQGWRKGIALDLQEYLHTLIQVREAYGDQGGDPSDWWYPYARHGARYDWEL